MFGFPTSHSLISILVARISPAIIILVTLTKTNKQTSKDINKYTRSKATLQGTGDVIPILLPDSSLSIVRCSRSLLFLLVEKNDHWIENCTPLLTAVYKDNELSKLTKKAIWGFSLIIRKIRRGITMQEIEFSQGNTAPGRSTLPQAFVNSLKSFGDFKFTDLVSVGCGWAVVTQVTNMISIAVRLVSIWNQWTVVEN